MPSAGSGVGSTSSNNIDGGLFLGGRTMNGKNHFDGNPCHCCPYGYHIDLDFVPFSKKMLSREGDVQRIHDLKDKWRSERQSMNNLLGLLSPKQSVPNEISTISRATIDIWRSFNLDTSFTKYESRTPQEIDTDGRKLDHIYNGLAEAVSDFEETLLRSRPQDRGLSYDIPDSQKYHTFPRLRVPILRALVTSPVGSVLKPERTRPNVLDFGETMFSDWTSKHEESTLNSVVQMPEGRNVIGRRRTFEKERIAELEEQVKVIPALEEKLALMTEEKKQLLLRVDTQFEKRGRKTLNEDKVFNHVFKEAGELNNNDVINDRGSLQSQVRSLRKDASVGVSILTRDVGISNIMPRTRSIGVGGTNELSSAWEISRLDDTPSPGGKSPSGTIRRRIRSFDTGVQVNECELDESKTSVPVLQIVEKIDFGAQIKIDDPYVEPVKKYSVKSVGITAKPKTSDVGVMHKPEQREVKCNTESKVRTRHIGVTACIEIPAPIQDKPDVSAKSVRSIASNTDKLSSRTISLSTSELTTYATNYTQTMVDVEQIGVEENESSYFSSTSKLEKKPHLSLPVSHQNVQNAIITSTSATSSETSKGHSRIPRLASPIISPVSSPKMAMKPMSQQLFAALVKTSSVVVNENELSSKSYTAKPAYERSNTYTKDMEAEIEPVNNLGADSEEDLAPSLESSNPYPSTPERREKIKPSQEMQGALKVLNDALLRGRTTHEVNSAIRIILQEWFRVAGTMTANPLDVEDYLDMFESYSPQLLRYIVNMPDGNGNTAMHYAVSHGNFDVVSILLDSKVCDPNKANKSGYTIVMLVSLAHVLSDTHRQIIRRLFSMGDVNIKAVQHGQTALMLAASHARLDTMRLLLESGADMNIQDEDGSTALMCASEHGHGEIVKYLLAQDECDPLLTDNDGSTALNVAMEAGHKDIGVMLYAHMHFMKGSNVSPSSKYAWRKDSTKRTQGHIAPPYNTTPGSTSSTSPATSSQTSPVASKKQSSRGDYVS